MFKIIVAKKGEKIEEKLKNHRCWSRLCQNCFEMVDEKSGRPHQCKLAVTKPQKFFHKINALDIETFEVGPDRVLRDNILNFQFE